MKRNLFASPLQLAAPAALAQLHPPAGNDAVRFKEVFVSATRTKRPLDDVPGAVSVITADEPERKQPPNSVDPLKPVTDLRYDAPGKRWGAQLASNARVTFK